MLISFLIRGIHGRKISEIRWVIGCVKHLIWADGSAIQKFMGEGGYTESKVIA
jgi:hypothetical protein